MSLSEDQFKALMKGLNQQFQATAQTIVNGLPAAADAPKRENNLVKIETFSGKDDEDAVDWVQQFEAAAQANGWNEDRLVAIAAGHLRGAALDWYLDQKGLIEHFNHANDANADVKRSSFTT